MSQCTVDFLDTEDIIWDLTTTPGSIRGYPSVGGAVVLSERHGLDYTAGADNYSAFAAAITELNASSTKSTLIVPPGVWEISSPLIFTKDGSTLVGAGWANVDGRMRGTVIRPHSSFTNSGLYDNAIVKFYSDDADRRPMLAGRIRDIQIDGNDQLLDGSTGHGVYFRVARGEIVNLSSIRNTLDGLHFDGAEVGVDGATVNFDTYDGHVVRGEFAKNARHGISTSSNGTADLHFDRCVIHQNTGDGLYFEGASFQSIGLHVYGNAGYNLNIRSVRHWIALCKIENAGLHGIILGGTGSTVAGRAIIIGNGFKGNGRSVDNTYDDLYITGATNFGGVQISLNSFTVLEVGGSGNLQRYGINVDDGGTNLTQSIISKNIFIETEGSFGTGKILVGGATGTGFKVQYEGNIGFLTRNVGVVTMPLASTVVTVTHNLDVTPSAGEIIACFHGNPRNSNKLWVGNITATTFDITVDVAPGVNDISIAWHADCTYPVSSAGA